MAATWRVRDKATISALTRHGRAATSGPVRVTWLAEDGPERTPPRLAYAVGRRTGGAVTRNLVRRRLRSIASELAPGLSPGAYLVAFRATSATPYDQLRRHLTAAVRSAGALSGGAS